MKTTIPKLDPGKLAFAHKTILQLIGNVDHSTGHGANSARMRGDLLNSIRDICTQALTPSDCIEPDEEREIPAGNISEDEDRSHEPFPHHSDRS